MNVQPTGLPEVLLITPRIFRDNRGAFWEAWNQKAFVDTGLPSNWVQDNCSVSARNVVRAIHYQLDQPQGKLIRVTHGAVFDVAVDLRRSSPNFGRHVAVELSAQNALALYIPAGFGHGFAALTDDAMLSYKVNDYYSPAGERTVLWSDPDLDIPWPISAQLAIVSDKDRAGSPFRAAEVYP